MEPDNNTDSSMRGCVLVDKLANALNDVRVKEIDLTSSIPQGLADLSEHRPFVIEGGCVGIPVRVVPAVIKAAWTQLQECTRSIFAGHQTLASEKVAISRVTLCILALNVNHHTAWNWRKQLVEQEHTLPEDELGVINLLSTYKRGCKSDLLWYHRRWIVDRCISTWIGAGYDKTLQLTSRLMILWTDEAAVCSQRCERYPRNYHCWVYRWWCFLKIRGSLAIEDQKTVGHAYNVNLPSSDMDKKELRSAQEWIECHPADYAAMHYFHLLANLVCSKNQLCDIALSELARTEADLNTLYANYESIWNHRRWCITMLVNADNMHPVEYELAFLDKIQNQSDGNSAAIAFVNRQAKWLSSSLYFTTDICK